MKRKFCREPGFWISALGLLALGTMFALWWRESAGIGALGRVSACVSAALFAAVCLRFVPDWMRFWGEKQTLEERTAVRGGSASDTPAHVELKIFVSLLAVSAAVILLVFLLRKAVGYGGTFLDNLEFWRCTDSAHYLDIARDWYLSEGDWDRVVQLVFLPGYPIAVRLLNYVVGYDLYSGMIVSALSFAGAGCVFYRLLRLDWGHRDAVRTLKYLCILPGAFFFTAPMSESLFLLLCASCIYCARTGKWALGGLFGGLAAFTRSLGLTLFVPLFFELIRAIRGGFGGKPEGKLRWVFRAASLLLIPAGFAVYCWINYLVSGDPFRFMEYENAYWSQRFGYFFNTAAYQLEQAIRSYSTKPHNTLGLWIPNLIASFGSLVLMGFAGKKLRPSYTAWFLAYFFIAIGATWLLSAPRYLIALIPVVMGAGVVTKRPKADVFATIGCVIVYLLYLYAFVMRWQVW